MSRWSLVTLGLVFGGNGFVRDLLLIAGDAVEARADGHLFITVLGEQFVQFIRSQLKDNGIHSSSISLREIFSVLHRVAAAFARRDERTLNLRKATQAESDVQ